MLSNPSTHHVSIIITLLLILTSHLIRSHDPFSSNQRCQLSPQLITVEPEADVTIGAVLPVHAAGEGVYGCGAPTHDGVQVFEAMRWAVDVLNRKSGLISDSGGGSLIPGVKIGLKVYDSCGHSALAVDHLTTLFPVLKSGHTSCDYVVKNTSLTIGVVDMSGSTQQPEVAEAMRDSLIPSIKLSLTSLVPPERMAQILHTVTKDLKWSNILVIHEDEEYSLSVTKQLTQSSAGGATCISSIFTLPRVEGGSKTNRRDLKSYRKIFRAATSGVAEHTGVIVVTKDGEATSRFLQVMAEFPEVSERLQWLFSWIPSPTALSGLGSGSVFQKSRIYSVAPYPARIQQFEDYWSDLIQMSAFSNPEDRWFLEYLMAEKGCKVTGSSDPRYTNLPMCSDRILKESPIHLLQRTSRAVPALTSIFTLATAFHKAWETKCTDKPGMCPALRDMLAKEFVARFLEPVEFLVGSSTSEEDSGRRTPRDVEDKLQGSKLSLTRYFMDGRNVNFQQVIVYEAEGSKLLDESFETIPSACPQLKCRGCVRPRQARFEDSHLQDLLAAESSFMSRTRSGDITIPILLPLHESGLSPLECGSVLNAEAVQNLEAALWTVGRVNEEVGVAGPRLELEVLDTCSSPLLATQRLATYLASSSLDIESGMVVVAAGAPEETIAAVGVLRPLNISIVSASDLTPYLASDLKLGLEHKLFQIESPVDSRIQAALEVFQYMGWKFVSVVHEDSPISTLALKAFLKAAKKRGVCVGQQFEMQIRDISDTQVDKLMQGVIDAKARGSRVVVLIASEESTKKILRSLGRFLEASAVNPGDIVLVGLDEWGRKLDAYKGLEKEALGSIIFKQETGEVSEFSAYYQRLLPSTNPRNSWFDELWQQEETNTDADSALSSQVVGYKSFQSTTNTIQAIVAVAAGIATLRNNLCQLEAGLCPTMVQHPSLQRLISEHIFATSTPRLDHPGQTFMFNSHGYGNTPTEVYNYRRVNGKNVNYLKVGSYDNSQYHRLSDMTTYTAAKEIPMETITSACTQDCFRCQYTTTSHYVARSNGGLYVAVALGIHQSTPNNPLICGELSPGRGFQNFEAVMWALDIINADQSILPGVDLGAVVFDTCNSREKAAMDISNFLSGTQGSSDDELPPPESIVALVTDGPSGVMRPLVDLTMPLGMTTVASSVRDPEFLDVKRYSHMLKMDLPSDVVLSSFVSVLRHFHWKYVSVVYTDASEDPLFGIRGFEELKRQLNSHGIEVAVEEKVEQNQENMAATMDIIAHRLKIRQNTGARAVILLLSPSHTTHLLSAIKRLQHLGRSKIGDFIWLAHEDLDPFRMFPDQSSGALVLRTRSGEIPTFQEYFTGLDVRNNGRNPWFREYWEQVFACRGNGCSSGHLQDLRQVGFVQDKSVARTVNAIFSIALGLDALRRASCGQDKNWCGALKDRLVVRDRLLEKTRTVRFNGLDGNPVAFGEGNYAKGKVDVFNFRDVGKVRAFVNVGHFDEAHGLSLNSSLTRGYDHTGHQVSLSDVQSLCNDTEICARVPQSSPAAYMKIPPNQEFVIGVMMPVHNPGDSYFTCSREVGESAFQTLLALSYALDRVNGNGTVLPQIKLGALIFDHCGRRQKAEEQIFSFIASDGSLPYGEANLKSRAMVAALTLDPSVADDLSPLFESALIPQISAPPGLAPTVVQQRRKRTSSVDTREEHVEVKVVVDILERFDWKYITLIHSGSESDHDVFWNFVENSKEKKICISRSLVVRPGMTTPELLALFSEELGSHDQEAKVVVMLLEDPKVVRSVLEAAKEAEVIEEFLWIGIEYSRDGRDVARVLHGVDIDFLLIRPETYEVPGFRSYYSSFSPSRHFPVPDAWFEEFWQHRFRCHLPQAPMQDVFPRPCDGTESLGPLDQDIHVYHTVAAVTAVAESLHDYLRRYCHHGDAATSLDDCGPDARAVLWREMRRAMGGPASACPDGDCGPLRMAQGYQVFQLKKNKLHYVYQQVGLWKESDLSLRTEDVDFTGGTRVESRCRNQCQRCLDQLALEPSDLHLAKPPTYANFRTTWGVVVTALSMLGVVLVIICACYFLISFQVTVGTTVLGYMILFGLFLLYAVNFAFVLSPNEATCGVRRFGLGLAYAVVFAGLLVKAMHIWRVQGCPDHVAHPAALLVVAVGLVLIQVVVCCAWLVLLPPTTGLLGGEWRCHPASTFEDELVVSLAYCMLMLVVALLFSMLTWHSRDNNRESRWIFTCCLLIALVWVAWTVVSTRILHTYRDLTISAANLLCASVVMVCMYLRKVYLYHRLTRDHEKKVKAQKALTLPHVPNLYGTLTRTAAHLGSFNTGCRSGVLSGDRSAPSRLALIEDESGSSTNSSSEGSSQVQPNDLYPLDMYDGGSQFQPPSLRLGGSSLVLNETQQGAAA
ncbi:hypothetical protein JTE90_028303 [Oedothorax gibbosus]|uniref:G-protein coupled receptors family 3 profile domain-containing protein n=1 Tax=Oedothorax gibbosus TaxID=931172 RepID=A0AAV6TZK6_9ARAC|nr:hypothetical protein JTE90_028303 [Oedothorax gibbosus]